jgi:hypothetical protein
MYCTLAVVVVDVESARAHDARQTMKERERNGE